MSVGGRGIGREENRNSAVSLLGQAGRNDMNENPFAHSDELMPPPQRRFGIASRVMWFAFGFVACFALLSILFLSASYRNYQALGPHDYSRIWPAYSPETKPERLEHAKLRIVNGVAIVAADDVKNASAMVYPVDGRMMTWYEDTDRDGHTDSLCLWDKKGRYFQLHVADCFKQYDFTDDVATYDGGTTFYDYDLDGVFDCKVTTAPKTTFSLLVNSQWCQLVPEGDLKGRVEVDGKWRRAVYADDKWRLEE
jgi:hypothetical protein